MILHKAINFFQFSETLHKMLHWFCAGRKEYQLCFNLSQKHFSCITTVCQSFQRQICDQSWQMSIYLVVLVFHLCSDFMDIFFYLCCRHFYLIDNDYYKVYFIFTMILLINSSIFVKRPLWEKKSCCKLPNGHEPMQWHQKQTSPITFIYIEYIHIYFFLNIYIYSIYRSRTCIQ